MHVVLQNKNLRYDVPIQISNQWHVHQHKIKEIPETFFSSNYRLCCGDLQIDDIITDCEIFCSIWSESIVNRFKIQEIK